MALQLIDFTSDVNYIEIDSSKIPYSFAIKLLDRTFEFTIKYNEEGGFFTVDLLDINGKVLVFGDVVRYGRPLFNVVENEFFPIPVIIPICLTDDSVTTVTRDNFGKEVKLYLFDRRVE